MNPGRWFRFYDTVVDDPKVQRLSDQAFRAWVNLLCIASKNGGIISKNIDDIAFSLRVSRGKARDLIQVLLSAELIEQTEISYKPHNWSGRQYKSDVSTERVKRFRKRDETVSETPPDTDTDTDTDTEKDDDDVARAKSILLKVCERLGITLQADPARVTWHQQMVVMLRDGLDEASILAATEKARINGRPNLSYIRSIAFGPSTPPAQAGPCLVAGKDPVIERMITKAKAEEDEQNRRNRDSRHPDENNLRGAADGL